jgi:uncharacterized protein (TIGR03546 family)
MLFWLNWIKGLLHAFNADTSPNQTAGAFVLGATIGLIPKSNLSALIMFLITYVIRVNLGVAMLAIGVFTLLGYATDPWTEKLGFWLLTGVPALQGLWTAFYNLPVVPYFSLNNTLMMGNLAAGLLLALPMFFLMRWLIVLYHQRYRQRLMESRFMQAIKASDTYQKWEAKYQKYKRWADS